MQDHWQNTEHPLVAAQHVYEFTTGLTDAIWEANPNNVCTGIGCITNPTAIACRMLAISHMVWYILYILTAVQIATEIVDHRYEKATLGPDVAIYGYEF